MLSARALAAQALHQVISGRSLSQIMPSLEPRVKSADIAFFNDLVRGSCRHYHTLNALAKMLLDQPFKDPQQVLHALLVVGLYQLHIQKKAPHAALNDTVAACDELTFSAAKPVINACLRRFTREHESLLASLNDSPVTRYSHPKWLLNTLKRDWPDDWSAIAEQNNARARLCLRVNKQQHQRDDYLAMLHTAGIDAHSAPCSKQGIYLERSLDVTTLPGFSEGAVSVQDEAAQLACELLAPQTGERVLDACAAPGGKTCHLLEHADIELTALDVDSTRLSRVNDNLARLKLEAAQVLCGDMADPSNWWDGTLFDAILLDAPCSATGVIRRHPDIKLLRQRTDIDALTDLQAKVLDRAWSMLKPNGRLLYATCSVLKAENSQQIEHFLARTPTARHVPIDKPFGKACNAGIQLLPQLNGHDGFYYALLQRNER